MLLKVRWFRFFLFLALVLGIYGLGRLYFHVTGGFTMGNISSDFTHQPQWEVRPLNSEEEAERDAALNQSYHYLGKGCQSYVFVSADDRYVIKFFKYQRFRMHPWILYFPPLPAIEKFKADKKEKKWKKLDGFVQSWKVAFENLKEETGLVYVHLNKTTNLEKTLTIYDKIGLMHTVDLDQYEFCIQRKGRLLCDQLIDYKNKGDLSSAQRLVDDLLALVISEYERGLADNDHALMQNTGVANGKPMHLDVGQFVLTDQVYEAAYWKQELFTKNYKFKVWLNENYPELGDYLNDRLHAIIGEEYQTMQPIWRNK